MQHHLTTLALSGNQPRPHPSEPGTLAQQLAALDLYLDDPDPDRRGAWERARALTIPHARRGYLQARRAAQ